MLSTQLQMAPTIVLVSGANRGLGKGFVQRYLETPSHTVIAANRNPEHPSSEELANLPKASGSSLIVVKVDASSDTDALDAARELQKQGIDHLDVVIANAAIAEGFPRVEDTSAEGLLRHVNINTCGVLRLYQATIPLLRRAASPKFATISSLGGSIEVSRQIKQEFIYYCCFLAKIGISQDLLPFPNGMYGPTKAAVNWLTKKINAEEENLAAFALSPG